MFQRYTDIIFKQQVYELGRRDPDLAPWKVDDLLDKVTTSVHDAGNLELESFLFEERMTGIAAASASSELESPTLLVQRGGNVGAFPSLGEMLSNELKQSSGPNAPR